MRLLVARLTIVAVVLVAACNRPPAAEQVADEFVRAYFVRSDMAAALKLASGSAKAKSRRFQKWLLEQVDSVERKNGVVGARARKERASERAPRPNRRPKLSSAVSR